jgi:hypothetical protein
MISFLLNSTFQKCFFVNFFFGKTAKKGITVLPKSAAKPDISIFYRTLVASVPDAVVHTSSKKELPHGHFI